MPSIASSDTGGATGKNFARLFSKFGVSFTTDTGTQRTATGCPFCDGPKFSINDDTGQWQCLSRNTCGKTGNATTFLRHVYAQLQESTPDTKLRALADARDVSVQTLRAHGVVWDSANAVYWLPYRDEKGAVLTLQSIRTETGGKKLFLPCLGAPLYGRHGLAKTDERADKTVIVCEGAWDLIAVDQHLKKMKVRTRYDLLAVSSSSTFKPGWLEHFAGYKEVRLCFDADKAGRDGMERVVKLAREAEFPGNLLVLAWPEGTPEKYDLDELIRDGKAVPSFTGEHCKVVNVRERQLVFTRLDRVERRPVEWLWPYHLLKGTLTSFSGPAGTGKSLIMKDLAARATSGGVWPDGTPVGSPQHVVYLTSEDSEERVLDLIELHGGDPTKVYVYDLGKTDGSLDLLTALSDLREVIRTTGATLVVADALNSFVGGDITSDAKARRSLSGPLHYFARQNNVCLVGVRNEDADGRAMGSQSVGDVGRCVIRAATVVPRDEEGNRKPAVTGWQLRWGKINDSKVPEPLSYEMKDCSTGPHDSHLRKVVWKQPSKLAKSIDKDLANRKR